MYVCMYVCMKVEATFVSFASFCLIMNELVGGEGERERERGRGEKGREREGEGV